jgi:hypothetical protein
VRPAARIEGHVSAATPASPRGPNRDHGRQDATDHDVNRPANLDRNATRKHTKVGGERDGERATTGGLGGPQRKNSPAPASGNRDALLAQQPWRVEQRLGVFSPNKKGTRRSRDPQRRHAHRWFELCRGWEILEAALRNNPRQVQALKAAQHSLKEGKDRLLDRAREYLEVTRRLIDEATVLGRSIESQAMSLLSPELVAQSVLWVHSVNFFDRTI